MAQVKPRAERGAPAGLRRGRPVWLSSASSARPARYPVLTGRRPVDVAIVGGGFTGALIALHFAEAGVRVGLVEASLVGCGSTAASSALLLQEPDLGLVELTARYGAAAARRIWELGRTGARDLARTLRRHRIDCALAPRDAVYYTRDPDAAAALLNEHRHRTRAGFGSRWLTARTLRSQVGLPAYAAIRTRGGAQFDPYRACVGLVKAAAAAGALVFERSAMRRIETGRPHVSVQTARGTLDADHAIIATGYATAQFRPLIGRFRLARTYVLATRPLTARQRRDVGLEPVMLWDTERPYHYARWTADHRLLLGGADRPVRGGVPANARLIAACRALRAHFERLLPALADIRGDFAWEGLFATTPDSLPYIGPHRRFPRLSFALGYGGNGMTFGSLAARFLLEQWQGTHSPDHALFSFSRLAGSWRKGT
jgi:glycine/D-amino acid oxidase-like deaminating enzyme